MMTGSRHSARRFTVAVVSRLIMSAVADIVTPVLRLSERTRQRRALSRLDEHLLRDIGLSAETVRRETERPFWR